MYPNSSHFLLFMILFIFFPQSSVSQVDEYYRDCAPMRFECGDFRDNISYPFQVDDGRPDYCGHPGYKITCENNSSDIQIGSRTYRIAGPIDYANQLLTIVEKRFDDNGYCPIPSDNDYLPQQPLFGIANPSFNVTVCHNCSESFGDLGFTAVPCIQNFEGNFAYYTMMNPSALPTDVREKCEISVLPVLSRAYSQLTGSQMTDAVKEGFQVYWSVGKAEECLRCLRADGVCGSDPFNSTRTACFCRDPSQFLGCLAAPPSGNRRRKGVKTAIGLSTGVGGIITILSVFLFIIKKKTARHTYKERLFFWRSALSVSRNVEAFLENYGSSSPKRYNYSDIKKMTGSFKNKLGQGGFGGVYKGKLHDGTSVAVKLLNDTKAGNGEEFMNEVASIGRTSHVNVVTLMGFCSEGSKRALVYEFMPNGSLEKYIFTGTTHEDHSSKLQITLAVPHLGWEKLYKIAVGIGRGLEYLHRGCATRILHFDIKPHNILLDKDFCPKISDFGLAKLCPTRESIISMLGTRGTVGYIAPEVFCRNFGGVSHKSDVYSYGMMVLEMVGGRKNIDADVGKTSEIYFPDWIYERLDRQNMRALLLLGKEIATEEEQEKVRKMILVGIWCIQTNPANRPSMSRVLEMLEGSLEAIQVPPKPYLYSPPRSLDPQASSTRSTQLQLNVED